MRRIKWFVPPRDDDPYSPFGIADLRAATLYGRQDGSTAAAGPAGESPDARARRNRAFWEAGERSAAPPRSKGLLHALLRCRRDHR
ncbi:hypothetical protein [Micromonospora tulbaghiae]|uniref:hypothetical protein n=1 Tax=Micromonospora tulbaghiae TaxID=479978 RepID=UPI0029C4E2E1|nr:hypothetical protein [Micromonospora tulbaghiae]MDX5461288.1 hypothetical protein [Micromonospora tulbaghiae]